jgi:uncharacterized lipoprotein
MRKALIALCSLLFITGCTTTERYTQFVYVPTKIPEKYLECKQLVESDIPADLTKLTDDQVATLLKVVVSKLETCGINARTAKSLQDKAIRLAEEMNKRPAVRSQ